jgi:anti-sigma factor RsiW
MNETRLCGNPEVLVSYLYEEDGPAERQAFEAHLRTCEACARDVREFGAVRTGLAQWTPPEPRLGFRVVRDEPSGRSWRSWFAWPVMPAWAQLGAAALLVGVAVGLSGLEVRYDGQGVTVRTGWSQAAAPLGAAAPAAAEAAPWRAELVALEQKLRSEQRPAEAVPETRRVSAPAVNDPDLLAQVRRLILESEQRQDRELALRLTQVVRDMDAQRRADLVRVADGIGAIEGRTVSAVAQQRQMLDYLMRVSTQREPR